MDARRRRRADALFDEALNLPADQRDRFLDLRCAGESDLRADVAHLLRLAGTAAPALDAGCSPDLLADAAAGQADASLPRPGDVVGAWRIERQIGQGGMGAVFLVERADGQFTQTGALKLIRAGVDAEAVTRRFERERQILASLSHPHIARLLDGGRTADGRSYFVMEHVEGQPIDRACDARRLSIGERLVLVERVCLAIQHAHNQLVVHRDIKPSNIVVTADGDVKLLDFGIAGMLEPHGAPGEPADGPARILTPAYASPEQVRGLPPAIASDIYQIGLLLYELLTGLRAQPVDVRAPGELVRLVCDTTPPPPSERIAEAPGDVCAARGASRRALARALRGDLDAIVDRALRKEPGRRYPTAAGLAEDLRRHRLGLPVGARADSVAYRAGRFVRRHRIGLAAAAAVLLTIGIAAPIVTYERMRAAEEHRRARQVEDVLGHLFSVPSARQLSRAPSAEGLVEHAARLVRRDLGAQPASRARLMLRLGHAYLLLGRYDAAAELFEDARAARERVFGADSAEVAECLLALAEAQHYGGRYADAERNLRSAGALRAASFGPAHPDTLAVTLELGDLLHTRGDLAGAAQVLEQAIADMRRADAAPEMLSRALRDLGNVQRDRGDLPQSDALFRESLQVLQRATFDASAQEAITRLYHARLLTRRGALADADAQLARALPALRRFYESDHPMIAFALQNRGYLRMAEGRRREAAADFDAAARMAVQCLGAGHPLTVRIAADRAELVRRQGRAADAIRAARRVLDQFARIGLSLHPAAIDAHWTLARALLSSERGAEAAPVLRDGLAKAARVYVPTDDRLADAHRLLARAAVTR